MNLRVLNVTTPSDYKKNDELTIYKIKNISFLNNNKNNVYHYKVGLYGNIGAEKRIYYIFQFDETSISISTLYTNGGKKAKLEVEIDMALVFTKRIWKSSKPETVLINTYKYDYERTKAPIENGTKGKWWIFMIEKK